MCVRYLILIVLLFPTITYALDARYIKVLLDSGAGGIYNGSLSVSELEILGSDGVNYAAFSTVTASSYYGVRYPSKAIDGSTSTIFSTADNTGLSPGGSEWLLVDLGASRSIDAIKLSTSLLYNSAALTSYRILAAPDLASLVLVASVMGSSPTIRTDTHSFAQNFENGTGQVYFDIDLRLVIGIYVVSVLLVFVKQVF